MAKLKSWKQDTVPVKEMILRFAEIRRDTARDADNSLEVVIASENPVERYDDDKDEVYNEILSMKGVKFRSKRRELPIVDSHDRSTVRNVIGSVRNIRTEGTQLIGDATFARDADSQNAYHKIKDGHLTDFSITAQPNDSERIQRGDVYMHGDVEISGPAEIVKSWTPTDASLVAAGADVTSTVRELLRAYTIPNRSETMNAKLREQLIEKGMPDTIENAEDALTWRMSQDEATTERMDGEDEEKDDEEKEEVKSEVDRALATDAKRRKTIRALCEKAKIERDLADKWCDDPKVTVDQAREEVLERMVNKPLGGTVRVIEDGHDSFVAAARTGLVQRALSTLSNQSDRPREPVPDVPGCETFRTRPLWRIAEEVLERAGVNTRNLSRRDVAEICLGRPGTINRHRTIMRDAYHTTGTFTNLLLDAKNKSLSQGYAEAFFTWNIWAKQGASVEDFKDIHRIRFSESPDPAVVPEGTPYPEKTTADAKETYKVEKYGAIFSTTWETLINDDMDALSRIPMMHGNACRRKQNKLVYSILTANANMSDGNSLFDATNHSNYTASGTAISVASLGVGYSTMMLQTGIKAEIIGVVPRFLIMPPAVSGTGLQVVNSMADVSIANEQAINLYGPAGGRSLIPVVEPQLAANDVNAWYLVADSSAVDTVELTFLSGEESPVLESEWDITTDCYLNKVRQTMGAAAIDWRGMYLNAGA